MTEDIKELLEIVIKGYKEEYIINLDLSDSTKNMLKRQLRKTFLDEDLIGDLETIIYKHSIPKLKIKEKIKELDKQFEEINENEFIHCSSANNLKIQVLQELLEK